jgi:hypothetical protein
MNGKREILRSVKISFFSPRGMGLCFALSLLFSLNACTTLSPINAGPERPSRVPGLEYVQPQWQPFAEDLTGGLDYFAGKIRQPRLEFRALRVDLLEPVLRIVLYGGPKEGAVPGEDAGRTSRSTWVSGFVRRYGLLAGINASPFDPVTGKEGEPQAIVGVLIKEGILVSPPVPQYEALVFYTGGGAAILNQGNLGDPGSIQNAAGGFYRILEENRLSERLLSAAKKSSAPRHPRSAAGLSAEGRYLYLLVIDGRRPGSAGATEAETALILRQLGAARGINLDGGGSSSLALRFPDGTVRPVNIPIHGGIPGRERGVASCLGIGLAPAPEESRDSAGGSLIFPGEDEIPQ